MRGLVQLCMEKLNEDIEEIFMDDSLFAHLLDEVLSFELELKEFLGWVECLFCFKRHSLIITL